MILHKKSAMRKFMSSYLKQNNIKVKDRTEVNATMSVILEGVLEIDIPRDWKGEYKSPVNKKYQNTVTQNMEEKSISMYAKGPLTRMSESAKFWLSILNGLKNQGVEDILIIYMDELAVFPQALRLSILKQSFSSASLTKHATRQSFYPIKRSSRLWQI